MGLVTYYTWDFYCCVRNDNIIVILAIPVDPCTPTPCANNGNCTISGPLNYTCECTPGYTGPTCSEAVDGCPTMTCPNNSVCVNGIECDCLPGFQLNGDVCMELPTLSGASDQPGPGMFLHA